MEGDDVLLVEMDVKVGTKRDEWMTTLPPERKHAVTTQSTKFSSRTCKDGRGDTSMWTDTPSEKAQKAKMKYAICSLCSRLRRLPVLVFSPKALFSCQECCTGKLFSGKVK